MGDNGKWLIAKTEIINGGSGGADICIRKWIA